MKTSNKLIITGLIVTVLAVLSYDFVVKAAFDTGNYKIPYQSYTSLPFKNFDRIDMKSSTVANVKLVQGPFSVRIDPDASDFINVTQTGNRLQVAAKFERNYLGNPNAYTLIISCPHLIELAANATYQSGNRNVTDTIVRDDWSMRQVLIEGFSQDSLHVEQDYGSTVTLENNVIRSFDAIIGKSKASGSNIIVRAGNHFHDFRLTTGNFSKFILENADITNLYYHPADSAKLVLSGNARHLLDNSKKTK